MKGRAVEQIPGDMGLSEVRRIVRMLTTEGFSLLEDYRHFGPVFRSRFLDRNGAILIGAEANRAVFQEQAEKLSSRDGWGPFMEHVFGTPMMLQDGDAHRRTRRLMTPALHMQAVAGYGETMRQLLEVEFARWVAQPNLALHQECRRLTLLIGIRMLLGVEAKDMVAQMERWYTVLLAGTTALLRVGSPFTAYGRACAARRKMRQVLARLIVQRQQAEDGSSGRDVLGLFLAANPEGQEGLDVNQVADELIHLLNGANFTVATALTWSIVELATRPEWRERLREEVRSVVGAQPVAARHLRGLVEMGWFLKEIERCYSPAGAILFRGVRQTFEFGGYSIPPGWLIIISPFITHRLPELFDQPDRFDPERFAPPREEDRRDPYALIGFGAGQHACIGREFALMELKMALALLLSRYDWSIEPTESGVNLNHFSSRTRDRYRVRFQALSQPFSRET